MRTLFLLSLVILLAACGSESPSTAGGDNSAEAKHCVGKVLFQQHCGLCHSMKQDGAGPALAGVYNRWNNDTSRIKAYIRNPSKMIFELKDPQAVASYEKFKPTVMTGFPNMSDRDLNDLIAYIQTGGY